MGDWAATGDWAANGDWADIVDQGTVWTFGGVDFRVELALGAEGGYSSIWDSAEWDTAGIWGGGAPVWLEVSEHVLDVSCSRGRSRYGERMRTGAATVTLSNTTGLFNPDHGADLPGALQLRPGRWVRISGRAGGSWVPLFTGYIRALDPTYGLGAANPIMRFYAQGFAGSLQQSSPPALASPIAAGQVTSSRVIRVLDDFGWTVTPYSGVQGGSHTMAESSLNASALEECQRAADAEGGAFFFDAEGQPQFRALGWLETDTRSINVQANLGYDSASSPLVIDAKPSWDALRIINDAQFLRKGASTAVRYQSALSDTLYGPKTARRSVECQTDAQALTLATALVTANRLDRITLDAVTISARDQTTAATMFGLELGDLVSVQIETLQGWGYELEAHINGIEFSVTGSDWTQILRLDDSFTLEEE